jgi:peptidoglycan hydrolase-like protein with peptidoglycan-binding domain
VERDHADPPDRPLDGPPAPELLAARLKPSRPRSGPGPGWPERSTPADDERTVGRVRIRQYGRSSRPAIRGSKVLALARPATRVALAVVAVLAMLGTSPEPTSAASTSYPYLARGDQGTNVRVIQLLLGQRGYKVSPDGAFGTATRSAVVALQARTGIATDGVVAPVTWSKLVVYAGYDSRGQAVEAIQLLLNEKRGAGLPVTGWFGPLTRDAVVAFQQHEGLEPDGHVGPITWGKLVSHFEKPNFAAASVCAYATGSNGNRAHWGTSGTIAEIERASRAIYGAGYGPVAVGDVSLEDGGLITGHLTHRVGLDADIRPMRKAGSQCSSGVTWYRWSGGRKVCCNPAYDRAATRALIKALKAAAGNRLDVVAFNDPQLIAEGLTMYLAGHDDHLHASFCEVSHWARGYTC